MSSVRRRRRRGHSRLTAGYADVQADRGIRLILFLYIVAPTGMRIGRKCIFKTRNAPFCR